MNIKRVRKKSSSYLKNQMKFFYVKCIFINISKNIFFTSSIYLSEKYRKDSAATSTRFIKKERRIRNGVASPYGHSHPLESDIYDFRAKAEGFYETFRGSGEAISRRFFTLGQEWKRDERK